MCLNIGTPTNHHFPFGTNEKVVVLGVPKLKHFRVITIFKLLAFLFQFQKKVPLSPAQALNNNGHPLTKCHTLRLPNICDTSSVVHAG